MILPAQELNVPGREGDPLSVEEASQSLKTQSRLLYLGFLKLQIANFRETDIVCLTNSGVALKLVGSDEPKKEERVARERHLITQEVGWPRSSQHLD